MVSKYGVGKSDNVSGLREVVHRPFLSGDFVGFSGSDNMLLCCPHTINSMQNVMSSLQQ